MQLSTLTSQQKRAPSSTLVDRLNSQLFSWALEAVSQFCHRPRSPRPHSDSSTETQAELHPYVLFREIQINCRNYRSWDTTSHACEREWSVDILQFWVPGKRGGRSAWSTREFKDKHAQDQMECVLTTIVSGSFIYSCFLLFTSSPLSCAIHDNISESSTFSLVTKQISLCSSQY